MGHHITGIFARGGMFALVVAAGCAGRTDPAPQCTLTIDHTQTVTGLGSAQGVFVQHGLVYFFGDAAPSNAAEYVVDADGLLTPTGRRVMLTIDDEPMHHPQGLTSRDDVGTFFGDTIGDGGAIYQVDWTRALSQRSLEGAVLHKAIDGEPQWGPHPELVHVHGRWLLASAAYGPALATRNTVRLIDPARLKDDHPFGPSETYARFGCDACGTFIQSLTYDETLDLLVLVQNRTKYHGWHLTYLDVAASIDADQAVVAARLDAPIEDELEGYGILDDGRGVFLSSSTVDNVRVGRISCPAAVLNR
jgi:hypothetical protein